MKNILNKIYFHPLFLISATIFVLMGYFKFLLYFMLLILVHELGHIMVSTFLKWNIDKVIILPLGAFTEFNEPLNRPLIEEFLIAISGVVFQFIFFLLVKNIIDYKYFNFINYFIIIFNLLPIYPLDGSKILNVILNVFTSYNSSMIITCIISYISIFLTAILFFKINKIIILVLFLLFIDVYKLDNQRRMLFNKFLLERYLNNYNFKHEKIIKNPKNMKREYRHIFNIDGKYITEKKFLNKMFDFKSILWYYFKRVGPHSTTTQKRF